MSAQPNAVEEVRHLFQNIFDSDSEGNTNNEPIFVSFDVAHGSKKRGFVAIGASFLDTRCITGSASLRLNNHDHSLLFTHTYNFQYGAPGVKLAQKRALFDGDAQKVGLGDRIRLLTHIFSHSKEEDVESCCGSQKFRPFGPPGVPGPPSSVGDARPVIVVGHHVQGDLSSLSRAKFSIAQVAPIVAVLDTQKIARELYWKDDRSKNVSLKELCTLLGPHPTRLHMCGNDAAYTLLALLGLASRLLRDEEHSEDTDAQNILEELVQIALGTAKTARQKWKAMRREKPDAGHWTELLDGADFWHTFANCNIF